MKAKHFLLTGLLFLGAAVFTGCSKEAKIEKNLWENGGEWNHVKYDYSTTRSEKSNNDYSVKDAGTIIFAKDGTYTLSFLETNGSGTWQYLESDQQLALTSDNTTTKYDMVWEQDKIKLEHKSTWSNRETITEKYMLFKK